VYAVNGQYTCPIPLTTDNPTYPGVFGGGVEDGETPEVAAKREYLEEAEAHLSHVEVVPVTPFLYPWLRKEGDANRLTSEQRERIKLGYTGSRTIYMYGTIDLNKMRVPPTGEHNLIENTLCYRDVETLLLQLRHYQGDRDEYQQARTATRLAVLEWIIRTRALHPTKRFAD